MFQLTGKRIPMVSLWVTLSVFCCARLAVMSESERTLPRVLIIGDSISIGYTPFLVAALEGRADLRHNQGNAQHSGTGLVKLDEWLGSEKWDVIQFNWGLWDLCYRHPDSKVQGNRDKQKGKLTNSLEAYGQNLERLVTRLKATGAQLVWANTTFVPPGEAGRKEGDDLRYNRVAEEIMQRHGILITDLNAVTRSFGPDLFVETGNVHLTKEGYQTLAVTVEAGIRKALELRLPRAP